MAKARVRLKHLSTGIRAAIGEVGKLRGKAATAAEKKELRDLEKNLKSAHRMMAKACPDTQFRDFATVAPTRARKTSRKGTRKVR